MSSFSVVSTFAGGGGSSLGYKNAGGNVLFANEFVSEAVKTYRANFPNTIVDTQDIRAITSRKKKGVTEWFESYGVSRGELDILDGSPPCATFSVASRTANADKAERRGVKYSDVKQDRIGFLAHDYAFLVGVIQPRVCVFENVPTIAKSDLFQIVLNRIEQMGYTVGYHILNAQDFGTPQSRRRLIMVGVRNDVATVAGISVGNDIVKILQDYTHIKPRTVKDAFNELIVDEEERELLLSSCLRSSTYELIRQIPRNPDRPTKLREVIPEWKGDFNLVRASWDAPSPTLTQSGQQLGRSGVHHPSEERKLTIGELKRLQGLPDNFQLTGTFNQQAERIGRMVPPHLMQAVASVIKQKILCLD